MLKEKIMKVLKSAALTTLTACVMTSCMPDVTENTTGQTSAAPSDTTSAKADSTSEGTTDATGEEVKDDCQMIMFYDIDHGKSINDRPDNGWWYYNSAPDKDDTGLYRCANPFLGTYDSTEPDAVLQHFYWMSSMGIDAVECDMTNWRSPDEGEGSGKYMAGVLRAMTTTVAVASEQHDFDCPKAFPALRLNGEDYDGLKLMLDDMYELYEKYSKGWYLFEDGTDNAEKPFIVIFANWDLLPALGAGGVFEDERFNIRWSNGFLGSLSFTKTDETGGHYIDPEENLWLFIETVKDNDGGYASVYTKADDGSVEMMTAWASLWQGGEDWDELCNYINGESCFARCAKGAFDYNPSALLIGRWNYPLAWRAELQEGISTTKSTHIEPCEELGFEVVNDVTSVLSRLEKKTGAAPAAPRIDGCVENMLFFNTSGFPLEALISNNADFADAEWTYINVVSGTQAPENVDLSKTVYVKTRNAFGESAASALEITVETTEEVTVKPSETESDGTLLIAEPEQLALMTGGGKYALSADIDLSGAEWTAIEGFKGEFDGRGFTISGLHGSNNCGLFALLEGAVIKNLNITGARLNTGDTICGILSTKILYGEISGVKVSDSEIIADRFVGGLVGINDHSSIKDITLDNVNVRITGKDTGGGIAGYSEFGMFERCLYNGALYAENAESGIGGIVGVCIGAFEGEQKGVFNCFAKGSMTVSDSCASAGGIVGMAHSPEGAWFAAVSGCGAYQTELSGSVKRIAGSYGEGALSGNTALETIPCDPDDEGENRAGGKSITSKEADAILK